MRIVGASGPAINPASGTRRTAAERHLPEAPETDARALVAVGPTAPSEHSPRMTRHPAAAFLAHLIATQMQAPQTRARRRAEPEEGIAVYQANRIIRQAVGRRFGRIA